MKLAVRFIDAHIMSIMAICRLRPHIAHVLSSRITITALCEIATRCMQRQNIHSAVRIPMSISPRILYLSPYIRTGKNYYLQPALWYASQQAKGVMLCLKWSEMFITLANILDELCVLLLSREAVTAISTKGRYRVIRNKTFVGDHGLGHMRVRSYSNVSK